MFRKLAAASLVVMSVLTVGAAADVCETYDISPDVADVLDQSRTALMTGDLDLAMKLMDTFEAEQGTLSCATLYNFDFAKSLVASYRQNWPDAIAYMEATIDRAPPANLAEMKGYLYHLKTQTGDWKQAKEALLDWGDSNGQLSSFDSYQAASVYLHENNIPKAVQYADRAYVLESSDPHIDILELAYLAHKRNGDTDKIAYFESELRVWKSPEEIRLLDLLDQYEQDKNYTQAVVTSNLLLSGGHLTESYEFVRYLHVSAYIQDADEAIAGLEAKIASGTLRFPDAAKEAIDVFTQIVSDSAKKTNSSRGQVIEAQPLSAPEPSYPEMALKFGTEGECIVQFSVDEHGKPFDLLTFCTDPIFDESSTKAVAKVTFTPKMIDGEPAVRRNIIYPLAFTLSAEE